MIHLEPLRDKDILILTPQGPLEQTDFEAVAREIDPAIAANGKVTGLMINMTSFPGWRDFGAFATHLKFVANHHRAIERIAVVTDSRLLTIVPGIAGHFIHPKIRLFGTEHNDQALSWLETGQ